MKKEFWAARWSEGLIGFNQAEANDYLKKHWPALGLDSSARVLVPLCGKSVDLLWLRAQGHAVVGVEFVDQAIHDFFNDHKIPFEPTALGWRATDHGPPLTLVRHDFLTLQPQQIGAFDAFYDRASVVALPPEMQAGFGRALGTMLKPHSQSLLLSFEYPPAQRQGPPFATDYEQLKEILGINFEIEPIERHDLDSDEVERFGVEWCAVAVYRLGRRQGAEVT